MKTTSVSNSYAKLLFGLASNAKKLEAVSADIQVLGALCKNMPSVFISIDKEASVNIKKDFLNTLISYGQLSDVTIKFLELVKRENKFAFLFGICESFGDLYRKDKNILVVTIKSVKQFPKPLELQISKELKNILKKEIKIDNIVDPAIMGGVIIQIGSYVIDNSFLNKLRLLKLSAEKVEVSN